MYAIYRSFLYILPLLVKKTKTKSCVFSDYNYNDMYFTEYIIFISAKVKYFTSKLHSSFNTRE